MSKAPYITRQIVAQFIAENEPADQRGQWQTLAVSRYTIGDQRLWVARRCKNIGESYEGMTEIIFLAVLVLETPTGTLELLPQDEVQP